MMSGAFLSQIIRRTAWCLGLALLCSIPLRATDPAEATITSPTGPVTTPTNTAVAFTATSTDSVGYDSYVVNSYAWTFGDGTTGASENTSHAYTAAGTYTVTLSVHYTVKICTTTDPDTGNCLAYRGVAKVATATRTITVLPPPTISSFSASSSSVEVGKPVTLSWATTNATSWSISGVGAVTGTSVSVSPTATTHYTLTATGGGGVATASVTVSTYTLSVTISPGSASLLLGGSQAFTGSVNPANQGLSWNATGGSMSGSTFTATASGTFTVKVSSVEDSTKTASATVTVAPVSVAAPVPVPATGQCTVGGTVSFTAQVAGAVDTGVTWGVNGGGSINPTTGVFTASTQGAYTVTATSHANPTKSATATVTVLPLVVTVFPATSTVKSGQTETLTASVSGAGSPSQGVTWSVVTANGGTITPTMGVYTAPATAGDYVVKATSTQDPTCFGTTIIHVPGWTLVWKKDVLYVGTKEVAEVDNTGKTWVEFDDHLGSPRYEWDGTPSPVLGTNLIAQKYAPFGEYLNDPTTQSKFEKGFTNHEQTDPSGLIYMQARFYAPMYGRFLSPDPARDQHFEQTQSWNIYSYVQNDPTMQIDPTGMVGGPLDDLIQTFSDGMKGYTWRVASNLTMNAPEAIRSHLPAGATPPDTEAAHLGAVMADIDTGGASVAGGGGALFGEGLGAPETGGASVLAMPATAVYAGTVLGTSALNLISDAVAMFRSGKSSGQSASGQATDKYGNKLGGSGKQQQHTVEHSSTKSAKDAARQGGDGQPVKHASPKNPKQGPHFHSTKGGKKIPNSTHHEFPK